MSAMRLHPLAGCAPEPLAHYLKALGVLRLVAEQLDPTARGFWRDDAFFLLSKVEAAELQRFFLHDYAPTPLLSPWNGGSGFYPKDSKTGIDALANAEHPRFRAYARAIAQARGIVGGRAEAPKKEEKLRLLQRCRKTWTGSNLEWLDAAVVLTGDDAAQYPALLGTGGNDGRLDFTNNQMQRLCELLDPTSGGPRAGAASLLSAALFGEPAMGLQQKAIGQFFPGGAGGANQSAGYDADASMNPWDFVLMLEGAIVFQVAAVRRLDGVGLPQAAAPFAVRGQAGGYASASAADESSRGEQWLPLWGGAASLAEVQALFAEGRLQSGARRAERTLDAAKAVARLGAARGVGAFVRYGYIERNGQANLAVPLGRWTVPLRGNPEVDLLDEIDSWVDGLRRAARAQGASAALGRSVRQMDDSMLSLCRTPTPARWQRLLLALAETEEGLLARPKATAEARLTPIPPLDLGWIAAADDGSPELRLACAIASQRGGPGPRGSIRASCVPLDPASHTPRFAIDASTLRRDPRVVWSGRDLTSDLGAVALRRLVDRDEHERSVEGGFPLEGTHFAGLGDVLHFLAGGLDERRIGGLARALMAVRWSERRAEGGSRRPATGRPARGDASALHALFRVTYSPIGIDAYRPRMDPAPLHLLLAGRLHDAARAARIRLGAGGARPKLRLAAGSPELARRLAASVAIPVHRLDLFRLFDLLCKPGSESSALADRGSLPQE